jgi:hypothetical protein
MSYRQHEHHALLQQQIEAQLFRRVARLAQDRGVDPAAHHPLDNFRGIDLIEVDGDVRAGLAERADRGGRQRVERR